MPTVIIQQNVSGYTGTVDAYVREGRPTNSYKTNTTIDVDGADSTNTQIQGLLSFSGIFGDGPGQIPFGAVITSASLTLSLSDGTSSPVSFYRMAQDWAAMPSLTWNSLVGGVQTDGIEALATADVSLNGLAGGVRSIDVMQSLQAWANGAANFGWLLSSGGSNGFAFSSSEGLNAPKLTVTYELPPSPLPGLVVTPSGGTTVVTEGGTGDSLLVALQTAPTSNVTIAVSTTGSADIGITTTLLTFTPQNWQVAQSVALSAIDDTLVEGSETFIVTMTSSSSDAGYNGLTTNVTVGVTDNDVATPPGLIVTQSGGTTAVAEGGTGDSFLVALQAPPSSSVTIAISTTGPNDIGITTTLLTFTTQNWQVAQSVTLAAIDDTLVEGAETFTVTMTASSTDAGYNGLTANITVGVTDNDVSAPLLRPAVVAIHNSVPYGSGDPSGLAYVPGLDLMFIVDSESDESPYFSQINLFATRLDGTFVESFSMRGFTREPTGLAYNPLNGLLYISDDDKDKIFMVDPTNPTVKVGEINLAPFGITDAEDAIIDPSDGHIYMLDGLTRSFIELTETGAFVDKFVFSSTIKDPEALAYDPAQDVFYVAGGGTRGTIFQTDHQGNILASFDLLNAYTNPASGGRPKIKGLELAPSSNPNDGNKMSLYAVDYGADQKSDGRVFEIDLNYGWSGV